MRRRRFFTFVAIAVPLIAAAAMASGADAAPQPASPAQSSLAGVSFSAPDDGWAVGSIAVGDGFQPLIEHVNGSGWSVASSPPVEHAAFLLSVSATSASDAWAVGYVQRSSTRSHVLIEHWDGQIWSAVDTSAVHGRSTVLEGVSAVSPDDVWAVGHAGQVHQRPFALHWDGAQWTVVSPLVPQGASSATLHAVSAFSSTDVVAVGSSTGDGGQRALVERWNGSGWAFEPTIGPGDASVLYGVDQRSSADAWAVGDWTSSGKGARSLVAHWDGTKWRLVPHWNVGVGEHVNHLSAVSAPSPDDVSAVGYFKTVGPVRGLILHWDGSSWDHNHELHGGSPTNLNAVQMLSPQDGFAAGSTTLGGVVRGMLGHWDGHFWRRVPRS